MTSRRFTRLRWRCKGGIFLSVEDWHEQVQTNLEPNVGDITTGRKPARCSRINFMKIRIPWTRKNNGALRRPKAQRSVKACRCKLTLLCNLHCKIGRIETVPDTFMIRPRDSVNRRASTYVYKGTTRQRFRDNTQQLESHAKRIRSLVIETLAIPTQLDVGFYIHRRGRTSIKTVMSLVQFNPFKLTRSDGSTTKSFHEDICRDKTTTVCVGSNNLVVYSW